MHAGPAIFYDGYIAFLNARDWDRLGEFVRDDAVHNGRALGVDGYRAMLEQNNRDIGALTRGLAGGGPRVDILIGNQI